MLLHFSMLAGAAAAYELPGLNTQSCTVVCACTRPNTPLLQHFRYSTASPTSFATALTMHCMRCIPSPTAQQQDTQHTLSPSHLGFRISPCSMSGPCSEASCLSPAAAACLLLLVPADLSGHCCCCCCCCRAASRFLRMNQNAKPAARRSPAETVSHQASLVSVDQCLLPSDH
jgi:hypothetical protein